MTPKKSLSGFRAIAAAAIGNMMEWYDFTVYALFAPSLAHAFFPAGSASTALVQTFLVFGAGFMVRPLGAAIIGAYSDRRGRRAALTLTVFLMAGGTGVIAFTPSFERIGIAAPLLVLLGRLLQGLSAGGEIGSAGAYLAESAGERSIGRNASWLEVSMGLSNVLGAMVAFVVSASFTPLQVQDFAWRIPFVIGMLILPVGFVMRRSMPETVQFERERTKQQLWSITASSPLGETLRRHGINLVIGFALSVLWAMGVYVLLVYTPVYVQNALPFSARQAFLASFIGNVIFVPACWISGRLSDRVGRPLVLSVAASGLLVTSAPLFWWLQTHPVFIALLVVQSVFCLMVAAYVGTAPAALAELFPTAVRSTGIALAYNAAFSISGFAPAWLTHHLAASPMAPPWLVMIGAVMALLVMPMFARRSASLLRPPGELSGSRVESA